MASNVSFIVLLVITVARAASAQDRQCDMQAYRDSDCVATISFPYSCPSASVDLTNLDFLKSCTSVNLRWAYPANNLTLIIGTHQHQAFTISINNDRLMNFVSHVFRIIDDKETEVTTKDHKLIENSDSHYQIKLKLHVPPELMPYLGFVDYNIY
ncbi:unnamed protein product [Rotaria socialis]|uniref:Uncharacterized protein n=1 Tax=Rotaria socialis TaxID=392032 RepID=A0A820SZD5_9BILA|nr:unnamed protein product [Rotaria socialis]CAF3728432.1 unnamed protein product [Rotaria socialis]CAF4463938.1 unnamed protein product [Rotaria socialis]CAF4572445.1 unnamed protein product [Rotaria socialis]